MRKPIALMMFSSSMLFALPAAAAVTGQIKSAAKSSTDKLDMSSDPKCAKLAKSTVSDEVVVNGGGLANTLVYITNAPKGAYKPKGEVVLDRAGCHYTPKVFGVMTNQKFTIKNSDPTLHNIHPAGKRGNEFNLAMPTQGQTVTKEFKKEQVFVPIKCDVHAWMHASAGVFEHPFFAATDANGKFSIDVTGLPDGAYDISANHPKLGEKKGKVTVAGGNGTVDFSY